MSRRDPFAWCPGTVRHLFRKARFGVCSHGVRLRTLGPITWASSCGFACPSAAAPSPVAAVLFALGHHREVFGRVEPWGNEQGFRTVLASAVPTTRERVIRAVPREQVFLAEDLCVYEWGTSAIGSGWAAIGFVLGLPVCAIAPNVGSEHALAPGGAS